MPFYGGVRARAVWCEDQGEAHTAPLGLEGRSKFKELLAAGAPRHPIGRFRPRRPGGRGTFSNFELWAPEVAVLGLLAVLGFGQKFPRRSARSQKAKVTSPCTPRETICMDMVPQHIFWPISGSFWGLRTRHQHRVLGLFWVF